MAGCVDSWLAQPTTEGGGSGVSLAGPQAGSARHPHSWGTPWASLCPSQNGDPCPIGRWVPQGKSAGWDSGHEARFPTPSYLLTTSYHCGKTILQLRKQRPLAAPVVTDSRQPQFKHPTMSFPTAKSHMPVAHRPLHELRGISCHLGRLYPAPAWRCHPLAGLALSVEDTALSFPRPKRTSSEDQRTRPSVGTAQ